MLDDQCAELACRAGDQDFSGFMRPPPGSALEEPHLHARQLDHVVVDQAAGLGADRRAIDQRIVVGPVGLDVHDVEAVGAARDGGDLHARAAQRGQRLGQLQLAAGECAGQHLQLAPS